MDKDFNIEILREAAAQGRIHWHQHALERFLERGISGAEILSAIGGPVSVGTERKGFPHNIFFGILRL